MTLGDAEISCLRRGGVWIGVTRNSDYAMRVDVWEPNRQQASAVINVDSQQYPGWCETGSVESQSASVALNTKDRRDIVLHVRREGRDAGWRRVPSNSAHDAVFQDVLGSYSRKVMRILVDANGKCERCGGSWEILSSV